MPVFAIHEPLERKAICCHIIFIPYCLYCSVTHNNELYLQAMIKSLSKSYRDILFNQTDSTIRGVLIHAVNVLDRFQAEDPQYKRVAKFITEGDRRRIAASAVEFAATEIMTRAAPEIVTGNNVVTDDTASTEQLTRAGVVCGLGIFTFGSLNASFIRVGLLHNSDVAIFKETQISIVGNLFPSAPTRQRIAIYKAGEQVMGELADSPGGQGQKFLNDFRKAVISMAANWDLNKLPERDVLDLISRLTHQLLSFQ